MKSKQTIPDAPRASDISLIKSRYISIESSRLTLSIDIQYIQIRLKLTPLHLTQKLSHQKTKNKFSPPSFLPSLYLHQNQLPHQTARAIHLHQDLYIAINKLYSQLAISQNKLLIQLRLIKIIRKNYSLQFHLYSFILISLREKIFF